MKSLSRRERQILDILYARGRATAAEVQAALPDPPSYSSVRALLRILEEKGHVRHDADGPRYVTGVRRAAMTAVVLPVVLMLLAPSAYLMGWQLAMMHAVSAPNVTSGTEPLYVRSALPTTSAPRKMKQPMSAPTANRIRPR